MELARRRALPDGSYPPGQTTCICRMGMALMEAVGMGSVPRLRKEGMGPMAADVWGNQELVKMMVPCEELRCSGAVKSGRQLLLNEWVQDGRCEQTVCGVHLREPSDDGPIARGFWGCAGCDEVWCEGCMPVLQTCEVCEAEATDWQHTFSERIEEERGSPQIPGSEDDWDEYQEEKPPDGDDWERLVPEHELISGLNGDPAHRYCPSCLEICSEACGKGSCPDHHGHTCSHVQVLCMERNFDDRFLEP
ncbi:hypothetical protein T484DRAFT_1910679, partial [Baffinella frigidus]